MTTPSNLNPNSSLTAAASIQVVPGEYIRCDSLKATISKEACEANQKDRLRKETCRDCAGPKTSVDINKAIQAEPSLPGDGKEYLPRVSWMRQGYSFTRDDRHRSQSRAQVPTKGHQQQP